MSYILAYDLGTTGNKATIYRYDGALIASAFSAYETYHPKPNWVEQDPEQWWNSVKVTTHKLLDQAKIDKDEIKVISFSGQMMGTIPININGDPLRKAIIWADQRSTEQASRLKKFGENEVYKLTGSRITPTYAGPKIAWIRDNEPEIYNDTYKFLFAKDYIAFKFTGNVGTDYSDASLSSIFDIKNNEWSDDLIEILGIDKEKIPDVFPSTSVVGTVLDSVASELGLSSNTLVIRGGGDGACATLGAGVFDSSEAYLYLGSSSWISTCSKSPFFDEKARTFNFSHPIPGFYCPTGTMQAGGASYQWIKDAICLLETEKAKELNLSVFAILDDLIDGTVPGAKNLIFLPYLIGERSPHWNVNAKGAFIGLSIIHRKPDMLRAVLEGVAFNLRIILDILESAGNFERIRLIGGGAKGRNWKQIIADIFNKVIVIPEFLEEATSMGAAIIGGIGSKMFSLSEARNFIKDVQFIEPRREYREKYETLYVAFKKSYDSLIEVYNLLSTV